MSKFKLSFSLILAIFLVGILSTAAFAKDPYGLKPVQSGMDLMVKFTNNSAAGDSAITTYDLYIKDDSTAVQTFTGIKATSTGQTVSNLTPDKVYTVELTYAGQSTVLSTSTGLVTDSHNIFSNSELKLQDGMINANQTGYNNTRKQRSGQKVHGFYTNNTNSCASCHQTHTAADNNLLMKDGAYSTCAACHDGTMGAKNVWAPIDASTVAGAAGTFNYTLGHNSSIHEADGSLKVSAAPGGNRDAADTNKQWGQEFDCASCHAPHGNGSDEENNLSIDPLGWGSVAYKTNGTIDEKNGKLFQNLTVFTSVPAGPTPSTPYIVVKVSNVDQATIDKNFWWKRAGIPAGSDILQTYRWDGSKYIADYSLWLQEKGYPYKADTILKDLTGKDVTRNNGWTVVWRDGFAFGTGAPTVTSATISIGVDVETTSNIRSLFDSTYEEYVPDSGVQMSKYCTSCHTDYLSTTRTNNTGLYTQAHRHQTASDKLTCIRCHYGHGSDAQIMKDANDQSYYDLTAAGSKFAGNTQGALDYLKDPNPSSALKRYTGMAVCYACHGKGEQFLSNQNNVDHPLNGDPGSTRTP
ncbi:cytochrome c3 family protein [Bacillus salipaludis]|uniref:cytochrome c3 family protein n=1 Tax=Bacillus salipaludis TaxID=2547811 RepID=UPI002E21F52A|nr:cytochrome c3 family protein [Bacillus salipaludis]